MAKAKSGDMVSARVLVDCDIHGPRKANQVVLLTESDVNTFTGAGYIDAAPAAVKASLAETGGKPVEAIAAPEAPAEPEAPAAPAQ